MLLWFDRVDAKSNFVGGLADGRFPRGIASAFAHSGLVGHCQSSVGVFRVHPSLSGVAVRRHVRRIENR